MAKAKLDFAPEELRDAQQALFQWCTVSLAAYRGKEVPDELLEQCAIDMEEALFDLPGPYLSGSA